MLLLFVVGVPCGYVLSLVVIQLWGANRHFPLSMALFIQMGLVLFVAVGLIKTMKKPNVAAFMSGVLCGTVLMSLLYAACAGPMLLR